MKRIRNPDTGRFHTPEEAFEALASIGGLAKWVKQRIDIGGGTTQRGILEIAVDADHENWAATRRVIYAAVPLSHEHGIVVDHWVDQERSGFDYYTNPNCKKAEAFDNLMSSLRQLLA